MLWVFKKNRRMIYVPACGWLAISFGHYLTLIQFLANFKMGVFTVVWIHAVVFYVVTPCRLVDGTDASEERTAPSSA
jgi:hypothetical protein